MATARLRPGRNAIERGLIFEAGPDRAVLDCPIDLAMDAAGAGARFVLAKGAKVVFVLTHSPSMGPLPSPLKVDELVEATQKEWRGWTGRFEARCRGTAPCGAR